MTKRRSLDETRTLLLDAGAELLFAHGMPVTLDQITLIEVCRRAGLSTAGSAYKIWPNQQAFRTALLHHLVVSTSATFATKDQLEAMLAGADGDVPPLLEVMRELGAANDATTQRPYTTYLVLWLAQQTDPDLATSFAESEDEWLTMLEAVFTLAADVYEFEFVPPFDAASIGVAVSALGEGLAIMRRATPELVPDALPLPTGQDGSDQPWTLFALGLKALLDAFTRPTNHS